MGGGPPPAPAPIEEPPPPPPVKKEEPVVEENGIGEEQTKAKPRGTGLPTLSTSIGSQAATKKKTLLGQ